MGTGASQYRVRAEYFSNKPQQGPLQEKMERSQGQRLNDLRRSSDTAASKPIVRLFPLFKQLVVLQKCHCSLRPSRSPGGSAPRSPQEAQKRKLAPHQHRCYETSPTVLKTCHCFPKGDYKNRAFCSGQGFWTASARARRSVCAERSGRAPGALMLQPREASHRNRTTSDTASLDR